MNHAQSSCFRNKTSSQNQFQTIHDKSMKAKNLFKRLALLSAGLSVLLAVSTSAQKVVRPRGGPAGSWRVIGTVQADFKGDHDTIIVAGPNDDFRKLKFKVTDAPLKLRRVVAIYDNGQPDKLEVRQDIKKGGESRAIDLKGPGKRSLRRIDFWYETKGVLQGKADVTVFGMK